MSAGRDVRGIKRGHQFDKVEMYIFCKPEESERMLEKMCADAEQTCAELGLTYRVKLQCTGDLGFNARMTYDIEVWAPGCKEWLEVSSVSNVGDFQARRANIKYRPTDGGKLRLVHTLNGSGLGMPRTLIAVLENYQQADGSVVVPAVLRPWMGGIDVIRPNGKQGVSLPAWLSDVHFLHHPDHHAGGVVRVDRPHLPGHRGDLAGDPGLWGGHRLHNPGLGSCSAVLTLLMITGATIDNVLMGARAHKEGAAWYSIGLGMLAGIVGTIAFPPFGGLIAAPLVVWVLEYLRQRDVHKALATLRGLAIGWGASFVVRFLIGLAMIGIWLVWAINR